MNEELIAIEWSTHLKVNVHIGFISNMGHPLINIVNNYLYSAPVSWLARPTCPGFEEINRVIMILQEAGLIAHWREKALRELEAKSAIINHQFSDMSSGMRKLNMQDMFGVFVVVSILLIWSFLSFLFEYFIRLKVFLEWFK